MGWPGQWLNQITGTDDDANYFFLYRGEQLLQLPTIVLLSELHWLRVHFTYHLVSLPYV